MSSHKAHCDEEIIPWLTTNWVLSQFSEDKQQAINAFRNFVMDGMRDGHREEFHKGSGGGNRLLGNDSFIDKVIGTAERKAKQALTLENLLDHVCRRYLIDPSALKKPGKDRFMSEARGIIAWLTLETGWGTLAELSKTTGRDISSLSSAVKRLQLRAKSDKLLVSSMKELLESIEQITILQA